MVKNILIAGASIFAALLLFGDFGSSEAQRTTRWEYCVINTAYLPFPQRDSGIASAIANVCYIEPNGCRNEEVRGEVAYYKFLLDYRLENKDLSFTLARDRAKEVAFGRAVSKLGAEGWEMITEPGFQFDAVIPNSQGGFTFEDGTQDVTPDIYFKRARP